MNWIESDYVMKAAKDHDPQSSVAPDAILDPPTLVFNSPSNHQRSRCIPVDMGALLSLPLLAVPSIGTVSFTPGDPAPIECENIAALSHAPGLHALACDLRCFLLRCSNVFSSMQCLWKVQQ